MATLVDMLQAASEADLEDIRKRIATKEEAVSNLKGEIAALRKIENIINLSVNGDRMSTSRPLAPAGPEGLRRRPDGSIDGRSVGPQVRRLRNAVAKHLANVGSAAVSDVSARFQFPPGFQAKILEHEWFDYLPQSNRVALSAAGKDEFTED